MEENRTRRALDELADLFLTGPTGGPPPPADAAEPSEPTDGPANHVAESTGSSKSAEEPVASTQTETSTDADEAYDPPASDGGFEGLAEFDLEGPAPIRLPPKTGPRPSPSPRRSMAHPVDEEDVAAPAGSPSHLRLYRDDEADSSEPSDQRDERLPSAAEARVEAVLLGNLPGLSGPWLTQYAQRLAQREGPVLLLHLDEQGLDMEMVEPTNRPQPPGRVPPGGQARDLVDRLETLVRLSPHPVRRVLVHMEASPKPMVLAKLRCLDTWTLLTGADDAATAAGAHLVQRMIETDPAATPRRIGVMMMGSDDAAACRGIAKLRSAASGSLESPIELVGSQRQMVPVNLRQLGRFEPMQTLWPSLRRWLAGLDPAEAQAAPDAPADAPEPETRDEVEPPMSDVDEMVGTDEDMTPWHAASAMADDADAGPRHEPEPEPRRVEPEPRRAEPEPQREPVASKQPEPASPPPASDMRDADAPSLATFLTRDSLAGGVALEARCPHQPDTELLLDQNGRLHLLRRHATTAGFASRSDDDLPALRRAMIELLEARAWVREHINLLQLTQRQCRIDSQADPVLHLFTHRADLATALTARLGSMLKLHLLQKVGQGEHATWFSTPLN